jgi:LacI family transcriptional regulator, gluconate utilization system Gnt-I transcriptional repressor
MPRPPANPANPANPVNPASPVTMADVAAKLGVSKMTVSRALNRPGASRRPASEALRQQILATCEAMGYTVDQTARTFSTKRSGMVAVLIPALNNSNFSDMAHGLASSLEPAGLQPLLSYTDYDLNAEERLLRTMLSRRPEAVVLTGTHHTPAVRDLLRAACVPVVETWDLSSDCIEHNVGFDNAQAVGALVRALVQRGHQRLAFVGGAVGSDVRGAQRRQGFVDALNALQLDASRGVSVGKAPVSMADGAAGVAQVMARWPDTQAVVCVSDHVAFGALAECQRRGWLVPQQIAIAGFGGFEVGTACFPQLSTVMVDCHGIGRVAGEVVVAALQARANQSSFSPQRLTAPYRVELRGSV